MLTPSLHCVCDAAELLRKALSCLPEARPATLVSKSLLCFFFFFPSFARLGPDAHVWWD